MKCSRCEDCGWVCENHPDRPWDGEHACTCGGAGLNGDHLVVEGCHIKIAVHGAEIGEIGSATSQGKQASACRRRWRALWPSWPVSSGSFAIARGGKTMQAAGRSRT
jgi:hypothetical protein